MEARSLSVTILVSAVSRDPLPSTNPVDADDGEDPSPSIPKISSTEERPPASNDQNQESVVEHSQLTQCPVCFMIFPFNVAQEDRQRHVEEHF